MKAPPVNHLIAALIVLIIMAVIATSVSQKLDRKKKGRYYPGTLNNEQSNQLSLVTNASFSTQPIMNKGEYSVFSLTEKFVKANLPGYRVFAQTSLGEVLRSPDRNAFLAINSKRVDILIVNAVGVSILAIEYQGDGHYQNNAPMRDAVKKEALRKAGVPTVEINANDMRPAIETKIQMALMPHMANNAEHHIK
jgi:hypothetical protein